ncbi:hypothetical protein CAPTEDRAFT_119498 [Capitella teleta]|uniref:Zinc/iron permease n=1 Tax=Capitella teleta TaxID=283909 RepID=R7TDC2_CAPTE|nr:hypothetical protein CAPTEDRAFT_119498 [Capitella teleta]|eukprot:ELT91733.1 hypothetical protein CAPTEDRAFT_119498 [Capitella teleta]
MERWVTKIISLVLIFGISLVANLLPIKVSSHFVRQGARGEKILSCLMCFGGGVFFATYMMHLAPEVNQIVHEALIEPYGINYPLSELIMVLGFFMILFLEYFVHAMGKSNHADPHHPPHPNNESGYSEEKNRLNISEATTPGNGSLASPSADSCWTRALLLLLALSLHHIFEGIGVGLQDSQNKVWSLCIAIISHEVVIAFSFGLQLVKVYDSKFKIVISAIVCNGMTPIGIVIGTVLIETTGHGTPPIQIANGILQALSTGVFIYVTFFEILQSELSSGGNEMMKLLSMFVGVVALALLVLIPEDASTLHHEAINATFPN